MAQPRRKGGVAVIALIKDKNAPGALAAELARSKEQRDAKVQAAEAKHARKRGSVINRGTKRIREIVELKSELEQEQRDLENIVKSA